jgi:hypothetical protein
MEKKLRFGPFILGFSLLFAAPITGIGLGIILWLLDGGHGFTVTLETVWIIESALGVLSIGHGIKQIITKRRVATN